jgi:hypothetical protein
MARPLLEIMASSGKFCKFVWHMIDEVVKFTFDFSGDIFVRPKTPAKKVTDMNKLTG